MRLVKAILFLVIIFLVVIQFIRPSRNENGLISTDDITKIVEVPDNVKTILKKSCYDCHSNNTTYPWYYKVQPVGWFLSNHISEGKKELNFSEFGKYSPRRRMSKLDGIINMVQDNEMPLFSYKLLHRKARLSENMKEDLIKWAGDSKATLQSPPVLK